MPEEHFGHLDCQAVTMATVFSKSLKKVQEFKIIESDSSK
jgi:hypothetical protein